MDRKHLAEPQPPRKNPTNGDSGAIHLLYSAQGDWGLLSTTRSDSGFCSVCTMLSREVTAWLWLPLRMVSGARPWQRAQQRSEAQLMAGALQGPGPTGLASKEQPAHLWVSRSSLGV